MKSLFLISTVAISLIAASCSNEGTNSIVSDENEMIVLPSMVKEVNGRSESGFVEHDTWQTGDKIGMFIYAAGNFGKAYESTIQNGGSGVPSKITFTQNNGATKPISNTQWQTDEHWYLLAELADVYAYYPYDETIGGSDSKAIPVSLKNETSGGKTSDYLYGKTAQPVSVRQRNAMIEMHHALAQLCFAIKFSPDYHNNGIVQQIQLENDSEESFGLKGTMDLSSTNDQTRITIQKNSKTITWTPYINIPNENNTVNTFKAAMFPQTLKKGLWVNMKIDNADWRFALPDNITLQPGYRYTLNLKMVADEIIVGGEEGLITITPWKDQGNGDITLEPDL